MTALALRHTFAPRGTAQQLFSVRDPEVLVAGPAGTGKSRACLEKLHLMALSNPGMRGMIVRKTFVSLSSTALVTWKTHVIPEALEAGLVIQYGGGPTESAAYRYTNGSLIGMAGMDKPTRIMSSEYDVIYVQEATELTETDWEALTTRLRNGRVSFQQLIADCNPDAPTHWLKRRCDEGRTKMLVARHEENPVLFYEDGTPTPVGTSYIEKLDRLTGPRKARLRHGQWVGAEGVIYEDFDQTVHVIDRFDIPRDWGRWWAVDFGFTNPFVCQMWAEDPDGRLYLYREIYKTRKTVDEHAKDILATVTDEDGAWTEPKPSRIICDHDAEGRVVLERAIGLGTTAANKRVSEGIQAVQARFAVQGDGKPRLYILKNALVDRDPQLVDAKKPTCTADELPSYIWDPSGNTPKEAPLKRDDHGCDAMRYLVAHKDLGGTVGVRWL